MPPHSEWPDLFGLFVPQLPELPNEFEPPVIPPGLPGFTLPQSVLPGFGELSIPESPSDFELDFFVYEGGFPIFKFESMYEKFLGEFNEKIDLSLYDSLGSGGQAEQLVWNINHTIMGVTFGPYTINFSDLISNAKSFSGIDIIRNVLVFILYTLFIYFIFRMLFF
jgi:hypothetical protein